MVILVLKALEDPHKFNLHSVVILEMLEVKVLWVYRVSLEMQVNQVPLEAVELQEHLVLREMLVLKDPQDLWDRLDLRVL